MTARYFRALFRRLVSAGAILAVAASLVIGLGDAASAASTRTWTLSGVTFDDGGVMTGSFDLSDAGVMSAVSITTSGGDTGTYGATLTYDGTNTGGVGYYQGDGWYAVMLTNGSRYLKIPLNDLSTAGDGDIVALADGGWECFNCSPYRNITAGSIVAGPVHPGPVMSGTPTISGSPQVGETLTGDDSAVTVTPSSATKFGQWLRDGSPIPWATDSTYTLTQADATHTISFQVSASEDGNPDATPVTSAPVGPITGGSARQLAVTAPGGLHLAGRTMPLTIGGLQAGDAYRVEIGGVPVATGVAAATGALSRTVRVPATTREGAVRTTVTSAGGAASTTITVVVRKTLGLHLARQVVQTRHRERVTVRGLVAGEHVRVKYRGVIISPRRAHADAAGVYRIAIHVGLLVGTKGVMARGAFYGRRAETTFRVRRG
jgi:hypothetical protein